MTPWKFDIKLNLEHESSFAFVKSTYLTYLFFDYLMELEWSLLKILLHFRRHLE